MGTYGQKLVGDKKDKILELLNKALADEWYAHYQYWIGAKIIKGPMKDAIAAELIQHATEEMTHAEMVADRIVQLGGTPVLTPDDWKKWTTCGYETPEDPFVKAILEQNIKGEQCAIDVYNNLLKETNGVDFITYDMAMQILKDEVEHEEDLQGLAEDLQLMFDYHK
ncbi:ferritin-like domain-containing protein [Fusibacter sp. JL216-2]|uniref:ferritin-like domain-containing protein n=1 Tax=Fusibacter sp. JL216-2 TaxID=3071453 RepID=UPI003D337D80